MKTLSDHVIGCDKCLGSWVRKEKVDDFIRKLKQVFPSILHKEINKLAGDKFI